MSIFRLDAAFFREKFIVRHRCGRGARFQTCFTGMNSTEAATLRPMTSRGFSSMKCGRVSEKSDDANSFILIRIVCSIQIERRCSALFA